MEELDLFPQEKEMYHHVSEFLVKVLVAWFQKVLSSYGAIYCEVYQKMSAAIKLGK